jgi:hypothetical protein
MRCAEHMYNFGYEWCVIIICLLDTTDQCYPGPPHFEGSECVVDLWWDSLEERLVCQRVQTYTRQHKNGKDAEVQTRQEWNSNVWCHYPRSKRQYSTLISRTLWLASVILLEQLNGVKMGRPYRKHIKIRFLVRNG